MAEMTVQEVKELFTAASFDGSISNQEAEGIWFLVEQQQQQIERLKCCGNCVNWVENTYMCRIVEVEMPLRFDKCNKWQGV